MQLKNLLFLALALVIAIPVFAQKKSTNVKGYYRKDGTYVKPHTRSYDAGKGKGSTSSYQKSSTTSTYENTNKLETNKSNSDTYVFSGLIMELPLDGEYLSATSTYDGSLKILPTSLFYDTQESMEVMSSKKNQDTQTDGAVIYVSVLRYQGLVIDICPIPRGFTGKWEFTKIQHRFNKKAITAEHALELISEYGWIGSGQEISKDFSFDMSKKGLPTYLTKNIEAMKLK